MDTLANIRQAVQDDLTVGDESGLYYPNLIDRAINRAYRKISGLFKWSELEDAKKTSTQANVEYYDYPVNWRTDSIWKLTILDSNNKDIRYGEDPDGSPLSFDDYLIWRQDNPDSTDKKWANQKRRYFVYPVPTTNGTNNISVWGIKVPSALSNDSDTTVFSYSTPELNEAIELETVAMLKSKGDNDKSSQFKSLEAKQIATVTWARLSKERAKYEKNQPFFYVPDYFGNTNSKNLIGKFDI